LGKETLIDERFGTGADGAQYGLNQDLIWQYFRDGFPADFDLTWSSEKQGLPVNCFHE
jgi:hypothetical protein